MKENWELSEEWLDVLLIESREVKDYVIAIDKLLSKYSFIGYDELEICFRKNNLPFRYFAEIPEKSKFYGKGSKIFKRDGSDAKYLLSCTTKSLENAKKDFDKECFNVESNLERLKEAGSVDIGNDPKQYFIDIAKSDKNRKIRMLRKEDYERYLEYLKDKEFEKIVKENNLNAFFKE